jgi:hypothetical protein
MNTNAEGIGLAGRKDVRSFGQRRSIGHIQIRQGVAKRVGTRLDIVLASRAGLASLSGRLY